MIGLLAEPCTDTNPRSIAAGALLIAKRLLLRANEAQHMRPAGEVGQAAWKGPLRHSVWSCCWPRRPGVRSMNREPMQDCVVWVVHKEYAPERRPSLYSSARFSRRAALESFSKVSQEWGQEPLVFSYRTPVSCYFSHKIFFSPLG